MNLLKITSLLFSAVLLTACASETQPIKVGADRDEHGCIGSAGYSWSPLLAKCVRLWEAGSVVHNQNFGTSTAYFILNKEGTKGELWLPTSIAPQEMQQVADQNGRVNEAKTIEIKRHQDQFELFVIK